MRNVVISMIALCLMILAAGCVSPLALQSLLPAPDAPTATPIPILSEEMPSTLVEEQLDTLSYWIGHWRSMRLTETPLDDPVLQEVMMLAAQSAADLDLLLHVDVLAAVEPYDAAEALVHDLAVAVGARYGSTTQATFEIRYATQVANLLLWFVNESMPLEEVQTRSYLASNYLSAALNSAQRAGLQGELLSGGLQLARNMARGAEPLEASRAVFMWRIRVLAWLGEQQIAVEPSTTADVEAVAVVEMRPPHELYISMGCIDCHYLEEPTDGMLLNNLIAPSLANLSEIAPTRVLGQDAERYVYESIVDPHAYEVEGFEADLMPLNYADEMSEDEIQSLVAWLLGRE